MWLKRRHNFTCAYTTITFRAEMLHCVLLQCRNTPGSYQCICPSGTQFNPTTRVCADINECKEFGEEACVGGTCVNVIGSYKCECEEGTIVDSTGRYCIGKKVFLKLKWWKRFVYNIVLMGEAFYKNDTKALWQVFIFQITCKSDKRQFR